MKRMLLTSALAIALTSAAITSTAQAAPSSGMLLGVYCFETWQGLRLTGTIPGYSADGRLYRHDVLRRATTDGFNIYPTRTLWQIEDAKDAIGPYQPAALEIFRPGVGLIYLWVEFQPVGGVAAKSSGAPQMKARIMTESEKPGAAALFRGGPVGGFPETGGPGGVAPPPVGPPSGFPGPFTNDAASLFGN